MKCPALVLLPDRRLLSQIEGKCDVAIESTAKKPDQQSATTISKGKNHQILAKE
jgi:hypothetical protein